MISLPTVFDKRLKAAVPAKSAWLEAWGFMLLGLGIYFAMACYTFNPFDYAAGGMNARGVTNLAGPFGALSAAHILGRFGVVGMVWPIAILAWGALTATGFVVLPKPRRFIGFFAIAADLAGFCEVLLPRTGLPEPSFGFGGIIGHMLKVSLMPQFGFGGSNVALAIGGIVVLVLSGNLKISTTADVFFNVIYFFRKTARKLWTKYVLNRDSSDGVNLWGKATGKNKGMGKAKFDADIVVESPSKRKRAPTLKAADFEDEDFEGYDDVSDAKASAKGEAKTQNGVELEIFYDGPNTCRPDASLFSRSKKSPDRSKEFKATSEELTKQLNEFKIMGEITSVTQGPVVTTYEFKPAPGTKVSKISALGEDLARLLKAQSLRVLAPIPGKDTVGFEVPNAERATIGFADLIDTAEFKSTKRKLPIAMGVDIFGKTVTEDLAEMPHLLVAGSTGSGKSVFMNTLIGSLIARHTASTLRLIMIDPKMVEMAAYNALPHMACPVITDPQNEAKSVLDQLVAEMESRYERMRVVGARNIDGFNEIVKSKRKSDYIEFEGKWAPMPFIVLIIDEMADMMMMLGKEAEQPIARLAQKARACGIHMVIATQRPSADIVTGLIKANFPTRVAFRVLSGIDSRTILDQSGAEGLLGKGDMLYLASGGTHRLHGAFLPESEVHAMVKVAKTKKK